VSLAAGAIAYIVSMRTGERELAVGFEPRATEDAGAAPPAGYTYLRLQVTQGPTLRERIQGFVGSLALIAVAIMVTVGALWGLGFLIGRLIESFVEDGGSQPLP
jgi:hypothetical protein